MSQKKLQINVKETFQLIIKKYENNQQFIEITHDFIKKLETHFKNKKNSQEWTSFINTVHNLYTQHIGKIMKKNNNLNEEVINEYFLYLLYMTNEKGHFKGEMLKKIGEKMN